MARSPTTRRRRRELQHTLAMKVVLGQSGAVSSGTTRTVDPRGEFVHGHDPRLVELTGPLTPMVNWLAEHGVDAPAWWRPTRRSRSSRSTQMRCVVEEARR